MSRAKEVIYMIHNRTCLYDTHYHIVFATKYRRKIFNNGIFADEMKHILVNISQSIGTTIERVEVMPDHVHLLISIPPKFSVSDIVRQLKGVSSHIWSSNHGSNVFNGRRQHLWSSSYFVRTVGNVSKNIVDNYIQNQFT